jgi:transposase-like protein
MNYAFQSDSSVQIKQEILYDSNEDLLSTMDDMEDVKINSVTLNNVHKRKMPQKVTNNRKRLRDSRSLSLYERNEILELLEDETHSVTQIAKKFNIRRAYVHRLHQIAYEQQEEIAKKCLSVEEKIQIVRLLREGVLTVMEIAKQYNTDAVIVNGIKNYTEQWLPHVAPSQKRIFDPIADAMWTVGLQLTPHHLVLRIK